MPVLLDWIDPGNAGGSVQIPQSPDWRPTPIFYRCPYCNRHEVSEAGLQNHVVTSHPIERPTLLLRGVAAESQIRLRRLVTASDFHTLHCGSASLSINGRPSKTFDAKKLSDVLSKQIDCEISIQLHGQGRSAAASSTYEIHIVVPDETHLDKADRLFLADLAKNDVGLRDVEKFAADSAALDSCKDYASGLTDYVLGMLIKDQSGNVSLEFKEYVAKHQSALALLSNFDRPLARIVCTFIRFSLNDFLSPFVTCGVDKLDASIAFFVERCGIPNAQISNNSTLASLKSRNLCPVDQTSFVLLAGASDLWTMQNMSPLADKVVAISDRQGVSGYDRAKAYVLLAEHFERTQNTLKAASAARMLSNDPVFGRWADHFEQR